MLLQQIKRQMLHAQRLTFRHPSTGVSMTFEAPTQDDMQVLMRALDGQ
jgi:23S rRNA-/tRNA-specific pseudouridylate synthase